MLDHVGLNVTDLERAQAFYDAALAPLGLSVLRTVTTPDVSLRGYGEGMKPFFWLHQGGESTLGAHVAFAAPDRATVDAFHAAALAAGGRDNGAPGLRPHYHPNYYGAFVRDPDGHNVEAVCHSAP
ncbi:VOC family protein [Phenylobacterium sp.]|uniref:VOC family protein n=1 Tax=Phenylobacterium sp. TaxID=1871053 RepID=UPI0027354859|nr:VOC family protein [Phenylobacterium sp.]MDP3660479.1 VOC family protein [Phenylobacterium sp.]